MFFGFSTSVTRRNDPDKRSVNPDSDNIPFLQPVPEHPIKIN